MTGAEQILKKHKLRLTQFRLETVELFMQAGKALSSPDIEALLPDSDRITLYRTLKTFEEKGIIHKAIDGTTVVKFALCESSCDEHHHHDEHIHFHCIKCDSTLCMDHIYVPHVTLPKGFKAIDSNMIINGFCEKCEA